MFSKRIFMRVAGVAAMLVALAAGVCNVWVVRSTRDRIHGALDDLPAREWGLVLATGKLVEQGRTNQHFVVRVDVAARLYHAGKVRRLILSGSASYDEPQQMSAALVKRGVPARALVLDGSGYRTLDSVVRARDVFKCRQVTIVSERFHDYRALFLCRYYQLDAVAYASANPHWRWMIRPTLREFLARVKAVLDLYVLKTKPAELQ